MPIPCKICNADNKASIEELILQGYSNLEVEKQLKGMGMDITHASVNRHKKEHMIEHKERIDELAHQKGNKKYGKEDSKNEFVIDASVIFNEIENDVNNLNYEESAKSFVATSLMLNKIARNQCAIVLDLQEKYMNGECKYPHEQIAGLDKIQSLIIKHESFQNKSYEYMKSIENKRTVLFKNENRHLDSELEIKKWFKNRPYVKGYIFMLVKHLNYDLNATLDSINEMYYPNLNDNINIEKYRSDEHNEDMDILYKLCDLSESNEIEIEKIKELNESLIKGEYEKVLKALEYSDDD